MLLTIDIETLPGQTDEARAAARAETKAPGTLKKAESIEAWWAEHGEAAVEDIWRKQALDPAMGEICAVGFAIGEEGEACAIVRAMDEPEGDFLRRALGAVAEGLREVPHWHDAREGGVYVVGHNVSFDLQFLRARCWRHRILPPRWLPGPDARAPRDYGDTMTAFAGFGGRIALSKLCACLGIADPKERGDGRDVLDLWRDGQHTELARYCAADVEATRQSWLRMRGCDCTPLDTDCMA